MKVTEKKKGKIIGFFFLVEAFFFDSEKSGSIERGRGGRQQRLTGLTLHPLFALALLFVLLLEFGYQARVHIPCLRNGTLLVLLYTGGTEPDRRGCWGTALFDALHDQPVSDHSQICFLTNWWASWGWSTNARAPGITSTKNTGSRGA